MKKFIKGIIAILLILIIIVSSIYLIKNKNEDEEQEEIFEELSEIAESTEETNEDEINLKELYAINSDIVGWIKIDDTNINYPVMQNKTIKDYYLRRNFYKEYSYLGTPYLSESCDLETSDNLIIYAHHINGSKMFGELENYKNEEFYKNHLIIKFYTMNEMQEYEIISVFKTTIYDFKYYNYINFNNEEEFDTFFNKCRELSFYNISKTVEYGDKFITLSTCEYSAKNGRLVVIARKI